MRRLVCARTKFPILLLFCARADRPHALPEALPRWRRLRSLTCIPWRWPNAALQQQVRAHQGLRGRTGTPCSWRHGGARLDHVQGAEDQRQTSLTMCGCGCLCLCSSVCGCLRTHTKLNVRKHPCKRTHTHNLMHICTRFSARHPETGAWACMYRHSSRHPLVPVRAWTLAAAPDSLNPALPRPLACLFAPICNYSLSRAVHATGSGAAAVPQCLHPWRCGWLWPVQPPGPVLQERS